VFTADHTNESHHREYKNELGIFEVPIIFYVPGDSSFSPAYHEDVIAQQIDIMPTVLDYLGYDLPFVSFGSSLFDSDTDKSFAVNYNNGIYQLIKDDYILQFDGKSAVGMYDFKKDRLLKENIIEKVPQQHEMEHFLKAVIQQYMQRMNTDQITIKQ
jgi:arylsulfatase A-like enzyme